MPETPVVIGEFHGLNLASDVSDVPPTFAADLLNVDLDRRGLMVRSRDGSSKFTPSVVVAGSDLAVLGFNILQRQVLVGNGSDFKTYVLSNAGAAVGSSVAKAAATTAFQNYGTTISFITYIANGVDTVFTWSGGAFAVPAYTGTTPKGSLLAVTPWDNRLVSAGGGAGGSRVLFSDPGTPTTFGVNNFIDMEPGDNETIQALVVWRDLLFVFKESKFFVFYGTDTAADGTPVFRYRAVRAGVGVGNAEGAIAGRDGVFFINDQGVWLSDGGPPIKVSSQLDELFYGGLSESWTGPDGVGSFATTGRMAYHNGKLVIPVFFSAGAATAVGTRTFVYEGGEWSMWTFDTFGTSSPRSVLSVQLTAGAPPTLLFVARFIDYIYKLDPTATQDDGNAFSWSYKSAKYRLADPGHIAITQETSLYGTGSPTLTLSTDRYADQSGTVTTGTAPTPAEGWLQKDQEGMYFQHKISGTAAAAIRALTHYVKSVKTAGIE